jgi:hypothetical protein
MYNNFSTTESKSGLDQRLINEISAKVAANLNQDIPTAQIARGIKRYAENIQPNLVTIKITGTVVSTNYSGNATFDNTFAFFGVAIGVKFTTTEDNDYLINSIQIANETNLLNGSIPSKLISQYTVKPLEFYLYIPPNANLTIGVTNGATTGATTAYFTFYGYRVPKFVIDNITKRTQQK